jgi:hypothetical protein
MSVVAGAATADFQREGMNRKGSEKAPEHVDSRKLLHGKKVSCSSVLHCPLSSIESDREDG